MKEPSHWRATLTAWGICAFILVFVGVVINSNNDPSDNRSTSPAAYAADSSAPDPPQPVAMPESPVDVQLALLRGHCDSSITDAQLMRVANKCGEIMAGRGESESPLSILTHVNKSIPDGVDLGTHPQDIFAAYVTLRLDGNR